MSGTCSLDHPAPPRRHLSDLHAAILLALAIGVVLGLAAVPALTAVSRAIVGPDLLAVAATAPVVDPDLVACREEVLRYEEIRRLAAAYDARRPGP